MSKKSVQKNMVYSIIKSCSTVIFPLATFPYISRVLLTDNVGKVNFGSSVVSYFSLVASLGVTTYAVRECSKVRENKEHLGRISSEIISINICTTILSYFALLIILIVSRPLASYRTLIIIQSSSILFTTLGADWLNTAMEDFRYVTLRTFVFQILSLVLMFAMIREPADYMKYAFITVVSTSGGNIANILYRRKYCKTKFVLNMKVKKHLPPIIKLFAMLLAQQIFVNSDATIIGLIRGDYEVGLYSASVKIYNIVSTLMSSIAWVVMSQMSYAFSNKQYDEVNKLLKYVISFSVTLGFPCVVGMAVMAPQIVEIMAGPAYINAAVSVRILAVSLAFSIIWGIVMNIILLPSGTDTPSLAACSISAIVNIVANLIFIPRFGFVAAAVTTAVSQVIGLVVCLPFVDKKIKVDGIIKIVRAPIVGCILIFIYLCLCTRYLNGLWMTTAVSIVGSMIIYFVIQILLKNEWVINFAKAFIRKKNFGN